MNILCIGDPHFKINNLHIIEKFINKIITLIQDKKPDFVVVLGDLLHDHEKIHSTVMNVAYNFIDLIRELCPVYVIVGNHDMIHNSTFLTDKHWMNGLKEWNNVEICDKGLSVETEVGKLVFCPYVFPGRFEEALNIIDGDWKRAKCIFAHQEFYGCKMGAIVSEDGDKWSLEYPYVISGHIHDSQQLQENVYYVGSAIQHAFGESFNKTVIMLNLSENVSFEKIDLQLPKKKILEKTLENIEQIQEKVRENDDETAYRVNVKATASEFKTFKKTKVYKELVKQGVKITLKNQREIVDVKESKSVDQGFRNILFDLIKDDLELVSIYKEFI